MNDTLALAHESGHEFPFPVLSQLKIPHFLPTVVIHYTAINPTKGLRKEPITTEFLNAGLVFFMLISVNFKAKTQKNAL